VRCRVVTWNVHSCVGADGRHDPVRVADVLAGLGADVIGLQEVDWRQPPVDGRSQLEAIAERLDMTAVAGANLRDHRGEFGNALLTRFEVANVRRVPLAEPGREPRGAIDARLRDGAATLRVLVTHLGLLRRERLRQVDRLRRAVGEPHGADEMLAPTVLLGDLNEWRPRRLAPTLLVPVPFPVVATGPTYPSRFPLFALDRVLVRPAPAALAAAVQRTPDARAASDHLPLVAELRWD